MLGLLLLVVAMPTSTKVETEEETEVYSQTGELELQLESILSSMEGVGKVKVMITTEQAQNTLFGEKSKGQTVCGVVVVAQGAGKATVDARILQAVKALFSVEAHKISIVKMKV